MEKESGSAADPALSIGGQATAWDQAMDVRMVCQSLSPGMEHGQEADFGAQVFRVGGDGAQCLRRRGEEQVVEQGLVLVGERSDGLGQGDLSGVGLTDSRNR